MVIFKQSQPVNQPFSSSPATKCISKTGLCPPKIYILCKLKEQQSPFPQPVNWIQVSLNNYLCLGPRFKFRCWILKDIKEIQGEIQINSVWDSMCTFICMAWFAAADEACFWRQQTISKNSRQLSLQTELSSELHSETCLCEHSLPSYSVWWYFICIYFRTGAVGSLKIQLCVVVLTIKQLYCNQIESWSWVFYGPTVFLKNLG